MGGACIVFIWVVAKAKLIGRRSSSLILSCLVFFLPVLLASVHYYCITRLNKGTLAFFGASGSVYEEFVTLFFLAWAV